MTQNYSEDAIRTLDWKEHIRKRPGMYIGKLGDGSYPDDGIYVLLKEVMDNSVDEYMMGYGKKIDVKVVNGKVIIRDFGRGIPLGKVIDVVSKINTGAKYDSNAFKKSVGLNGVGVKAVNALSEYFEVLSFRDGQMKKVEFCRGEVTVDDDICATSQPNGTLVTFHPDSTVFESYNYRSEYIETLLKNYTFLNAGLAIHFNGQVYQSKNGLLDLLNENMTSPGLYPIIHIKAEDLEIALTHGNQYGEEYYTFVNGQHTTQGGSHLIAFREAVAKTIRDFYNKNFDVADIRSGMIAAVSIKIEEPLFESQTKTKLGSKDMSPNGVSVRNYVMDVITQNLDNFLHKNSETADILQRKIIESEKERKAISGIQKLARERAKKVSLHNRKLARLQGSL
jgi:topoisomerase IV subunit B